MDIETQLRTWIQSEDYDSIFTRLCCGHFALAAEQAGMGSLYYLDSRVNPRFLGHVFVIHHSGRPFDIRGFRDVGRMKQEMKWCTGHPIKTDRKRIEKEIETIPVSDDYHEIIHRLAHKIVSNRQFDGCE